MDKRKKPPASSQLRIIGGRWRGRGLRIAPVPGLRPTGDRIRETLFNWLRHELPGARCLDLFAGSGALGLESLSRDAARVIMLEKNPAAARQLREHCRDLQADRAEIIQGDCLQWLPTNTLDKHSIHIAFIDPPFADNLWHAALAQLEASQLLTAEAMVYIEAPSRQSLTIPPTWTLHRGKQAGAVSYYLYRSTKP